MAVSEVLVVLALLLPVVLGALSLLQRRNPFAEDIPLEQCEVCGEWVPFNKAVIVTEVFEDDSALAGGPLMGGTGMSASYCPKHDPMKVQK